jgi:hypothetical protein
MRNDKMRRKWIYFLAPPAVALLIVIFGEVVMHLWNWLLPALFGWRMITFWQALGLLLLCRMLVFGHHGSGHHRCRRGAANWEKLTPEEREDLRKRMRRCGRGSEEIDNELA